MMLPRLIEGMVLCFPWLYLYVHSCITPQRNPGESRAEKKTQTRTQKAPTKMRPFISFYTVSLSSQSFRLGRESFVSTLESPVDEMYEIQLHSNQGALSHHSRASAIFL